MTDIFERQDAKIKTESEPDHPGVIAPPPLILLGAIALGVGLNFAWPAGAIPSPLHYALGGALIALGFMLMAWAARLFRQADTAIPTYRPTTAIVSRGPYGLSRNPIYLAMIAGLVGLAIVLDNLWLLGLAVPFILLIRYGVIAREERYLARKFADEYRRYAGTVRRWL